MKANTFIIFTLSDNLINYASILPYQEIKARASP